MKHVPRGTFQTGRKGAKIDEHVQQGSEVQKREKTQKHKTLVINTLHQNPPGAQQGVTSRTTNRAPWT